MSLELRVQSWAVHRIVLRDCFVLFNFALFYLSISSFLGRPDAGNTEWTKNDLDELKRISVIIASDGK